MSAKVTILMTVHNGLPYIQDAVESVLLQTLTDFSFLIVDDASTDGTAAYLSSLDDPRIRVEILPENAGQTKALNIGLELIDTPYVARLDADDVCMPGRLWRQMNFLDAHPLVALVGAAVEQIDEEGSHIGLTSFPEEHQEIVSLFPLGNQLAHSAVMFRLDAVKKVGGYPSDYAYVQDFALWIRLAREFQLANLPAVLVQLRTHTAQITNTPQLQPERIRNNLKLALELAKLPGISEEAHRAALLRAAAMEWKLGKKKSAFKKGLGVFLDNPAACIGSPAALKGARLFVKRLLRP